MSDLPTPITREERYLNGIAQGDTSNLPTPVGREEKYLDYIARNGGGGGGGTTNYNALDNKPQIAGTTLQDNKSLADLGIAGEDAVEDIYAVMGEMGAKNLNPYPYYDTTKTENGVTFIDNGDGTVTMSTVAGGATATTRFVMRAVADKFCLKKGVEYILTDGTSDSGSNTYKFVVALYNGTSYININYATTNGIAKFTLPDNNTYDRFTVYITVYKNTIRTTPVLFKPMIRLASDTDDTYQQYAKTNKQLTDDVANKTEAIEATQDMISDAYDSTATYAVGDYCIYENALYKCNTASTTGTWDSSKWDAVTVDEEVKELSKKVKTIGLGDTITLQNEPDMIYGYFTNSENASLFIPLDISKDVSKSNIHITPFTTYTWATTSGILILSNVTLQDYEISTFGLFVKLSFDANSSIVNFTPFTGSIPYTQISIY